MKKKRQILCAIMKRQANFYVALIANEQPSSLHVLNCSTFSESEAAQGLKEITKPYEGQLAYSLTLHFDQYCTLLTENRGMKTAVLDKTIRYLVAEQNNFQTYDDWLVYFPSMREGYLHVLSASPEKISTEIKSLPLSLDTFLSIDCYDYALSNAILHAGYGAQPIVLIMHEAGLVRCLLLENGMIRFVQETALFDKSEQDKSKQLAQRLAHYFQSYRDKPLLFLGLDPLLSVTQLFEQWRFEFLDNTRYESLLGGKPLAQEYLAVIGSGLYHAQQLT